MRKFSAFLFASATVFLLLGSPLVTHAQVGLDPALYPNGLATPDRQLPTKENTKYSVDDIRVFVVQHIVEVVLGIASTVALFFILNNGFWMITAAGGEKIEQAKKGLMWALIGLVLIMLSYAIIRFAISIPLQSDERTLVPAQDS